MKKLPAKDLKAITAAIDGLAAEPRPSKALQLSNRSEWRVRVGNFRILYVVEDDKLVVVVVKVGHRKDVYRT